MHRREFFTGVAAAACGALTLRADELNPAKPNNEDQFNLIMNLLKQTAGGKQFWADVWFFRDWRIQSNSLTGNYRLLGSANRRHASGTYDECREKMDEIRQRENLQPMQGNAVIILHGLFRTRS